VLRDSLSFLIYFFLISLFFLLSYQRGLWV